MTARRFIAACVLTALFIGVLALVGYLAEHAPTFLAFIGFGVLLMLAATRVEGRR